MNYSAIAQAYHQNGFEVVRGIFSADELREVVTEVEAYLAEALSEPEPGEVHYEDGPEKSSRCVFRKQEKIGIPLQARTSNCPICENHEKW